jgi:hypothetical protein
MFLIRRQTFTLSRKKKKKKPCEQTTLKKVIPKEMLYTTN